MAEGFANEMLEGRAEAFSAGTHPKGIDPLAVRAMAEVGIDISGNGSKHISEYLGKDFDLVVTVCDNAREECPIFPGAKRMIHSGFEDPPCLARDARSEEEALIHYRRIRDEIEKFIEVLPGMF